MSHVDLHAAVDRAERLADDAREVAERVAREAAEAARDAYERGAAAIRGEPPPYRIERAIRDLERRAHAPMEQHPVVSLLIAGAVGFGLASLVHAARDWSRREPPPTRRWFAE
ncbi:hypothetical protein ACTZWW_00875 [Salinarimonas sp. NSM]|uniref:hypothetical protein n=1 Tax=Salinarimonas sp. NSM TaxID=3458003 RepID=UPI0040356F46